MVRWMTLLLVLATANACGNRTKPESTELFPGFWSRSAEDAVRQELAEYRLEVVEDTRTSDSKRPPYHLRRILISGYTHIGRRGELELSFFNGLLMAVTFYPLEPEEYFAQLRTSLDLPADGSSKRVSRHTMVRRGRDYKNRPYVMWEDEKLAQEHRDWIIKYS